MPLLRGAIEKLASRAPEFLRDVATEHARDLLSALRSVIDEPDAASRRSAALFLLDGEVAVGVCRDLGKMSHTQYLMKARELPELATDDLCHRAADSRINFIKNHRRYAAALRLEALQPEHHARQLAARRDSRKRHRRLPKIRRHE